ncbi:ladderlectin-like [Dreissena polymorpha]|uniref:C-type lectin domain-containing protein n=1 Tax=Dreissena polymorpha TaxID=45954 RepID=A0A9D4DYZ8_DREPO|nr:ladderlectin-like [Dreissena polymorpha]KAH3769050.1 hypothetical protein DPMN_170297 [Dreissena polymorpha]
MPCLKILFIGLAYLCSFAFGLKCPQGFEEYNMACYLVVETKVDFFSAYRDCRAMKSYLLNVDATPELNFVKGLVERLGGRNYPGFWIGGFWSRTLQAWFWEKTDAEGRNTVTKLTPDNTDVSWWGYGEHSNVVNKRDDPEHWLMLKRRDLKLYSMNAYEKLGYICETVAE